MCRTKLSIENFNPKVDQEVWNDIKSLFPEEIKERAKEVEEDIKKVSAFKVISYAFYLINSSQCSQKLIFLS